MAAYPDDIDTFRAIENLPGLTYNADDTKTLFAEDLEQIQSAVVAVENTLGTSPLWDYPNLSTALEEMTGRIAYLESYAIPLGVIMPYGGTSAPLNFMICDGSAISRTTYADLFALIGTAFGSGDGTTTFNIPDMRERVAVGYKSGSPEFGTIGSAYGSKTHTLSTAELPAHNHPIDSKTLIGQGTSSGLNTGLAAGSAYGVVGNYSDINPVPNTGSRTATGATGSGTAHNIIQPSRIVNYIIRVDV